MASFYLRRRELDDTPVNGTTEKEDLEKLADWVEEHGVFQDTKGLLRATNTDLDLQLKRLFQRPGVCDDMVRNFVIRVLQPGILRSIPGPAHLRVLKIHQGTNPTATLLLDTESSSLQLSPDFVIEFKGRVAISPGVDAHVILKQERDKNEGDGSDADRIEDREKHGSEKQETLKQ